MFSFQAMPEPPRATRTLGGSGTSNCGSLRRTYAGRGLLQDGDAVGRVWSEGTAAFQGLGELQDPVEVLVGARIVATIRVRLRLGLLSKERVGAERLPIVRRAAILIHLGLAAEITDCGPLLRSAAIAKRDAHDLQGLELQPGGHIVRVARRVRGAAWQAEL